MPHVEQSGDFGFLAPSYSIQKDGVRIHRKAWTAALAALGPVGIGLIVFAFANPGDHFSRSERLTGRLALMVGIFLLFVSALSLWLALLPPRVVEISRERVRWGGEDFAASDIAAVRIECNLAPHKGTVYYQWRLVLQTKTERSLVVRLCATQDANPPQAVADLAGAARSLLGLTQGGAAIAAV